MQRFPQRIKELRIEKAMSQRDLAKATDISQSAIVQWENDKRTPTAEFIIVLA